MAHLKNRNDKVVFKLLKLFLIGVTEETSSGRCTVGNTVA